MDTSAALFKRLDYGPPHMNTPNIPFPTETWSSKSRYPAMLLETFLYGLYIVVFSHCAYLLMNKKKTQRLLLLSALAMFMLASAELALTFFFFFRYILRNQFDKQEQLPNYKFVIYLSAKWRDNYYAIYRCYVMWLRKRVAVLPIIFLISGTIPGYVSATRPVNESRLVTASFIAIVTGNIMVTTLIVGRIGWTYWKSRSIIGVKPGKLRFLYSAILESGMLYTIAVLLFLLVHPLVLDVSLTHIAGLVVSSMLIRVNSGMKGNISTIATSTSTHIQDRSAVLTMMVSHGQVIHEQPELSLSRTDSTSVDSQISTKVYD
ncbi:hypothetical protein BDQ17DRAFT_1424433 [Cyathus striatus]|nr:hypothetical protein BDQ17DRAFT_1424433 [Cyathus striatus]